jgi:hypothetical protein
MIHTDSPRLPYYVIECVPKPDSIDHHNHTLEVTFKIIYACGPSPIKLTVKDDGTYIDVDYPPEQAGDLVQLVFAQRAPIQCGDDDGLILLGLFFKNTLTSFEGISQRFPYGVTNGTSESLDLGGFPPQLSQPKRSRATFLPYSMSVMHRLPEQSTGGNDFSLIFCNNNAVPYACDPTIVNNPS